jgi:16S rRNA (cytosine1402-N4)-methyltransferase
MADVIGIQKGLFPYLEVESGMSQASHRSVLLAEAIEALALRPDGIYLDATFGRGGHAAEILNRLGAGGRLLAIDRDPEAVAVARERFGQYQNFDIFKGSFAAIGSALQAMGATRLDGVLMDLGVSSPQLDDAARGFSFMNDGPLDMRMDPDSGIPASRWLADATQEEIADVIWRFGEERQSRRIARAIVRHRQTTALTTTAELAAVIESVLGRKRGDKHPATRSFQAIRIFINDELQALDTGLDEAVTALAIGGRLVVISFHSLEDRRVKQFMRTESTQPSANRRLPVPAERSLRLKRHGGAIRPGEAEVQINPRARSAVMRVAERIA